MFDVEVSRVIAADPEQLYDIISDLPRMCELSEEHQGGRWVGSSTAPAVGARYKGKNANGFRRWTTIATVTVADRGSQFAYDVDGGPIKVSHWSYTFEPAEGGTKVTESWRDRRNAFAKVLGGVLSGVNDRVTANRAAMEYTLATLAAKAETRD